MTNFIETSSQFIDSTLSELKNCGVNYYSTNMQLGDVITFPKNINDIKVKLYKHPLSGKFYTYIKVEVNGRLQWLKLFSLCSWDKNKKFACRFSESLCKNYNNDYERISSLLGLTIQCKQVHEMDIINNNLVGNPLVTKSFPVIEVM